MPRHEAIIFVSVFINHYPTSYFMSLSVFQCITQSFFFVFSFVAIYRKLWSLTIIICSLLKSTHDKNVSRKEWK